MISLCRVGGIVTGFFLDALILAYYGMGKETDAFFVAIAFPFLITSTLDIQAPKVLVPILIDSFQKEGEENTYFLINLIITNIAVLLFCIALSSMAFAGILMPFQVPGLPPETVRLSIHLSMLLSWMILFQGIGAVLQSVLNVYHHYLVPSLTKLISNSVTILLIVLFHDKYGIYSLAFGYLLGSFVQLVIQIITIHSKGLRLSFVCKFTNPKFVKTLKLFIYPFSGHGLSESKVLLENFLASFLSSGSVSALRYASRIVQALSGVLLSGIITTTLPPVSHYAATNNIEDMKRFILKGTKLLAFVSLPLSVWLFFTIKPLLILLFERGEFHREDVTLTSIIILLMIPYILFSRVISITQLPFYATMDMRIPVLSTAFAFFIDVAFILIFFKSIGIYAFPIASSMESISAAFVMSLIFHSKFGALGWWKLKDFWLRMSGVLVIMIFGIIIGFSINNHIAIGNMADKVFFFMIPTVLGGLAFWGASIVLRLAPRS